MIDELTSSPWLGPSSRSMVAAVTPYVSWISAAAAQAEETASQARAAAAAYETAFTMTVPPPVIAANRVLLMTLIATNFFGQNTPAIAATEAQYMEMWAQDAAAMYGYAGSSALATQLTRFTAPPNTTTPDGGARPVRRGCPGHRHAGRRLRADRRRPRSRELLSAAAGHGSEQVASSAASTNLAVVDLQTQLQDFLNMGLPTPTNNWFGVSPPLSNPMLKQTLQAYFGLGIGNFGLSASASRRTTVPRNNGRFGRCLVPDTAICRPWAPVGGVVFTGDGVGLASAIQIGGLSVPASWGNRRCRRVGARRPRRLPNRPPPRRYRQLRRHAGGANAGPAGVNAALRGVPLGSAARAPARGQPGCPVRIPLQRAQPGRRRQDETRRAAK